MNPENEAQSDDPVPVGPPAAESQAEAEAAAPIIGPVAADEAPPAKPTSRDRWQPRTALGKKVKEGSIASIETILDQGLLIFEPEIIDVLLPGLENDLLLIGQAKGKFGGGQRRMFRQTQKKTAEGNKPKFAVCAVVGNKDGYVG